MLTTRSWHTVMFAVASSCRSESSAGTGQKAGAVGEGAVLPGAPSTSEDEVGVGQLSRHLFSSSSQCFLCIDLLSFRSLFGWLSPLQAGKLDIIT